MRETNNSKTDHDLGVVQNQTAFLQKHDISGISDTVKGCPDVSDPYEDTTVEVMESLIPGAGKGLFAKEDVEAGRVIAYFAGVVEEGLENDKSEYSITWIDGARLNIPEELLGSYKSSKVISTFQFKVMILYKIFRATWHVTVFPQTASTLGQATQDSAEFEL